jgi:hypothetical protein
MNESIYIDWGYVSEKEKIKRDCLKSCQFSSSDIDLILKLSESTQSRIFEMLKQSSWHIPKQLLK